MYLNPAAMFPWWQKTPSKLPWEQKTALKNDKSKSALQVMTAKLEARRAREDAQKDIRSWLIVQSILPVTSQGHRGQEMWHSAPSSVAEKTEQSIATARIYRQGLPICSYLLFDLFCLSLLRSVLRDDRDKVKQLRVVTKRMRTFALFISSASRKKWLVSSEMVPLQPRSITVFPSQHFYHQHFQIHSKGGRTEQIAL